MSFAGGGRMSFRRTLERPPLSGIWAPGVPSACWPRLTMQNSIWLLNLNTAFNHPAAVMLSKFGVTLQVYRALSPLGSSRQPQSSRIFRLGSGRLASTAFTIDVIVGSTLDVTIGSIDSSSPGQCHENSWVLVSPTLFPAMLVST